MGGAGARLRAVLGVRSSGPLGAWPDRAPDADALVRAFGERFGEPPAGVWHAPGRLALMGEHTAASGGVGLYAALPWGVTAALATVAAPGVRVAAPGGPLRPREAAARAVAEAVAEARRTGALDAGTGVRVLLDADLPERASLGHSAAAGTAVALALADLDGGPPPEGATVDQRVALAARPGCVVRVNLRTMRTTVLPFDLAEAGLRLVVVDTGALPPRDLRAVRSAELRRAQETLGPLRAVRDLPGSLRRLPDPALRRRVEYAVTEVHRINAAVGLLRSGRAAETGPILSASHLSLRRFGLPTPEADLAAETAARAGARGVRMSGWAGTVLALAAEERVDGIREALAEEFRARGWVPPRVRAALPSAGAHRLR
ncbi:MULTISPECIES: galactokinase family protein [unclassified Nocardiopsis]|uniref:galactokinase family protein n=1 Tax=unclassified Nocardiopsis TaxID=2649073 RepID=UPI001356D2E6|nr:MULTISPECIES: galactokinase family protein [unclassified Nocardiopsis]